MIYRFVKMLWNYRNITRLSLYIATITNLLATSTFINDAYASHEAVKGILDAKLKARSKVGEKASWDSIKIMSWHPSHRTLDLQYRANRVSSKLQNKGSDFSSKAAIFSLDSLSRSNGGRGSYIDAATFSRTWHPSQLTVDDLVTANTVLRIDKHKRGIRQENENIGNNLGNYLDGSYASAALAELVKELNQSISNATYNPILLAIAYRTMLMSVHPFRDGNTRTSQLLFNHILRASNLPELYPTKLTKFRVYSYPSAVIKVARNEFSGDIADPFYGQHYDRLGWPLTDDRLHELKNIRYKYARERTHHVLEDFERLLTHIGTIP